MKMFQTLTLIIIFPSFFKMETLRDKRKLAAINGDNYEERPKNNQATNTIFPRILEDYFFRYQRK